MSDLVVLLGKPYAQRLADVAGGTRLYVPKQPGPHPHGGRDGFKRLCALVGDDLATLLIFHFGDSRIYVPRGTRSDPVDPKAVDRLTRKGLNVRAIVRQLKCSERTVHKHRARTRDGLTRSKSKPNRKGGRT